MESETAIIERDAAGNILKDENGYVTCYSEGKSNYLSYKIWEINKNKNLYIIFLGGLKFQICYSKINFSCDSINCTVNNKSIFIPLNDNNNNESNKENEHIENRIPEDTETIEETFSWSDASTKLFLCLFKEKIHLLTTRKIRNKKALWQKIAEEMKIQGYNVSNIQTENKFKSLERAYKNMITNNKKTGRGRAKCPYET